jgi:hypothetical protein
MFLIIAFCAYALWRGTFRPFWPCCPSSEKKNKRLSTTDKDINFTNKDGRPTDTSFSPGREPGSNLQFWKKKDERSGDWGHHIYLTDLKRQAEAEAEAERQSGSGDWKWDEEAVRSAALAATSPKSENGGRRILRKSVGAASPLGQSSRQMPRSAGSTAHSHTHLLNPLPTSTRRSFSSTRTRTPTPSSGSPGSSTIPHYRALSPASTILTNPVLPPRHTSLYSPVSGPNRKWVPPPTSGPSPPLDMASPTVSARTRHTMAIGSYTGAAVPQVARVAYSPFAPKVQAPSAGMGPGTDINGDNNENGGAGNGREMIPPPLQAGSRDSVVSQRGWAV